MNFFIIVFFTLVVFFVFLIFQGKIKKKENQRKDDLQIEEDFLFKKEVGVSLEKLAQHSDQERVVGLVVGHITDYLTMGIHPSQLANLLMRFEIFDSSRGTQSERAIELSAKIQHGLLESLSTYNLDMYCQIVGNDLEKGMASLNQTFIKKVGNDMLIVSEFK
jgi:hypothetical protein